MPSETYSAMSGGAVRRIRTPHPHDVLSGRGGQINNHEGNKVFRDWVAERKEEYNLAPNKHEKTRVALEVMDRVRQQDPPGRFLQRDPSAMTGPVWWVEVDEARALAKTSQALREGAPQIRLAHKEELMQRAGSNKTKRTGGKRRRKSTATTAAEAQPQPQQAAPMAPPVPPSQPFVQRMPTDEYNRAMESLLANVREAKDLADQKQRHTQQEQGQQSQYWESNPKRLRLVDDSENSHHHVSPGSYHDGAQKVDEFSETPPLLSVPSPPESIEPLNLVSQRRPKDAFKEAVNSPAPSAKKDLPRVHSLALSDYSMSDTNVFDDNGEFINPFEDESGIAKKVLRSRQGSNGYLRNLSSNEDNNNNNNNTEPGLEHHSEDTQSPPSF